MTASRRICVDLLLECGCIHIQYIDSVIEEVVIENVWCEKHYLQPVTKIGEPYRDLGSIDDETNRYNSSKPEHLPLFDK